MKKLLSFCKKILRRLYLETCHTGMHIHNFILLKTQPCARIVLYHRIAKLSDDPILLAVTPNNFEEHLKFYKKRFELVSLKVLLERMYAQTLTGNELALTFDDGYQDNLVEALPLLEKYNVPATIFITTRQLGGIANFPWDKAYNTTNRARFLSTEELKKLADHPLITIGAHTVNHLSMRKLSDKEQLDELTQNKHDIESIIQKEIHYFAYPFGGFLDYSQKTRHNAQRAGFQGILTNTNGLISASTKPSKLSRFNIRNWDIPTLTYILKK